jgi:branched-subunit amino acid aminotransferase/4-amino-4-deoxychorismate lyase
MTDQARVWINGQPASPDRACISVFDHGLLYGDGITRAVVLQLAAEAGYTAQEAHLTTYDLYTADECFLTGTGAEMIPVRTVDGRPLGSCPGPVFQDLQQRFRDLIEVECGKNSRQTATPDRFSPTSPRH